MALLVEFDRFTEEKRLIGEMLMAYGEIEFCLVTIIADIFGEDANYAAKLLFRVKGEGARLAVADAIITQAYRARDMEGHWNAAYGAAKRCKSIRNQYAHCHWYHEDGEPLCFVNLDDDASTRDESITVQKQPVDLVLIRAQHRYFDYATALLYWLNGLHRKKAGLSPRTDFPRPTSVPQPPLSNLKATGPRPEGAQTI